MDKTMEITFTCKDKYDYVTMLKVDIPTTFPDTNNELSIVIEEFRLFLLACGYGRKTIDDLINHF